MKILKSGLIIVGSIGVIFLGACSSGNQSVSSDSSPAADSSARESTEANTEASSDHAAVPQAGGQVVESGPYHLEFVSEPESEGTHLDFYLQRGDNHEAIPDAKVIAQIQLPDGTQKTLPFTYNAEGKHYTTLLSGKATGQHQVKITSDINGKKVDGRFNFTQ